MKSPNKGAGARGSAEWTIPQMDHLGSRLVASHCPGCTEPLNKPYMLAYYFDPGLTRRINYYLCKPCGQLVERAGRAKRKRMVETVERNLADMGVLVGLERRGGEA